MKIKIAPSILSADFGRMNEEIASVEPFSDLIHVDVMDGHFVPNLTFGAPVVKCFKHTLPLECHLMITNPEKYIKDFAEAGAWMITVHVEVTGDKTSEVLKQIRALGVKPALSLNPPTPIEAVRPYLDEVDMVLVMTVNPGFGGQVFIEDCLAKISTLRQWKPELEIGVDGGINAETARLAVQAGATLLIAGSYVFKAKNRGAAIEDLRQ
ncbi:MAG: ribulose-phosphate 3-epimerase [Candidatus Gracilibacteria bacterium]